MDEQKQGLDEGKQELADEQLKDVAGGVAALGVAADRTSVFGQQAEKDGVILIV